MYRTALATGIIFAALGIVLGAFGAHALKQILETDQLQVFETGVRYQMYHSFALICSGILYSYFSFPQVKVASLFFILGILLFSGSLYALVLLKASGTVGLTGVGILTPIGGLFFILGWIILLMAILKKSKKTSL